MLLGLKTLGSDLEFKRSISAPTIKIGENDRWRQVMLRTPRKKFSIPLMAIIAALVALLGAGGFLYLERASKQTPAGPAPPSADARAYAKNLRFVANDGVMLENPKMESHESHLGQTIVEISEIF